MFKRQYRPGILISVFFLSALAGQCLSHETGLNWPQFGGQQRRFSVPISLSELTIDSPWSKAWEQTVGSGYSGVVVFGQCVFCHSRIGEDEYLTCLDVRTGNVIWKRHYLAKPASFQDGEFGFGPHATPVVIGDIVVFVGATAVVHAVCIEDGQIVWKRNLWNDFPATRLERGFAASPLYLSETHAIVLPLGGDGCAVIALDAETGATRWQSGRSDSSYASPVFAAWSGCRQVVCVMKDVVTGVDEDSGATLWEHPFVPANTVHVATPLVLPGNRCLVSSSEKSLMLNLKLENEEWQVNEVWTTRQLRVQVGNVVVRDNWLIAASSGGADAPLSAIDVSTAKPFWKQRVTGRGFNYLLIDGMMSIGERGDVGLFRFGVGTMDQVAKLHGVVGESIRGVSAVTNEAVFLRNGDRITCLRWQKKN